MKSVARIAPRAVESSKDEPPIDDAKLMAAIAAGDTQALRDVYRRYGAILLGLLDRILGNRAEAEDVLQEVFLQLWKKAGTFDERKGRALHWLTALARNRALDRLSVLKTRSRLAETGTPRPAADEPPDPADEASLSEEARRLRRALEQIPEEQRAVLLLAYFEGLSQSEIADRLGAPLGTVKSHVRVGLTKLRTLLRADPVEAISR